MAFDDPGGQNRNIIWYDIPVPITLAGTVWPGDLVGYSAGWVQADADGGIRADYVAVEYGVSGDKISVAKKALVDGYTDGTAGDQLYLSDTAGEVSVTTSPQKVGKVLASELALIEPEVYIEGGAWGSPLESRAAGETFRELWAKCTGAGHVYGERIYMEASNVASTSSQALRAEAVFSHASGHVASGGSAIHAAVELGVGNDGVAGILAGLNASVIAAAESRTIWGTFCALSLQSEIKAGNTLPANASSFIRCADAGAVKLPVFLHWGQAAAAGTGVRALTAGGNGAMTIVVNVNGTNWYIPLSATAT